MKEKRPQTKAELFSYNLDIQYRCPNCKFFFRLSNFDLPLDNEPTSYRCYGCNQEVFVLPIKVEINEGTVQMDLSVGIKRAITILSGMGYNRKQIDDMIDSVITDQQDPSVIVKLALSSLNDDE